jgi:hypothetical protein
VALRQASKWNQCDVRLCAPAGRELRPSGDQQQHTLGRHAIDQPAYHLKGRRISPVDVLDQQEERPLPGETEQVLDQRLHRQFPLLPWIVWR